jgi:hypothetical protein
MFRSRNDVSRWRIDNHDATTCSCFDVDIINPNPGAPYDLESICNCQYLACHLSFTANNKRCVVADHVFQLL